MGIKKRAKHTRIFNELEDYFRYFTDITYDLATDKQKLDALYYTMYARGYDRAKNADDIAKAKAEYGKYLPEIPPMQNNYKQFKRTYWKVPHLLNKYPIEQLYTYCIRLKSPHLYTLEAALETESVVGNLGGRFFWNMEKGLNKGVHMHVLVQTKRVYETIKIGGEIIQLNPLPLNYNHPNDKLEGLVRMTRYMLKQPNAYFLPSNMGHPHMKQEYIRAVDYLYSPYEIQTRGMVNLPTTTLKGQSCPDELLSVWGTISGTNPHQHGTHHKH